MATPQIKNQSKGTAHSAIVNSFVLLAAVLGFLFVNYRDPLTTRPHAGVSDTNPAFLGRGGDNIDYFRSTGTKNVWIVYHRWGVGKPSLSSSGTSNAPEDIAEGGEEQFAETDIDGGRAELSAQKGKVLDLGDKAKGVVYIVPGLLEHSGDYADIAEILVTRYQMAVFAMDLQGLGGSDGTSRYVREFDDYVKDLNQFITVVDQHWPELKQRKLPRTILGISVGALVAAKASLENPDLFASVALVSPTFKLGSALEIPLLSLTSPVLSQISAFLPKLPLTTLNDKDLRQELKVEQGSISATQALHSGGISARFLCEIGTAGRDLSSQLKTLWADEPTPRTKEKWLILYAENDPIADPSPLKDIQKQLATGKAERSPNIRITRYPSGAHQLLHANAASQEVLYEWLS